MAHAEPSGHDPATVSGLFRDTVALERAYEAAVERGYDIGDVNVVMSEATRQRYYAEDRDVNLELASKSAEGGELGGPKAAPVGIGVTIAAAVGAAVAVPASGFVLAGPIAVALVGAGAAGAAATLIGALADWGLPEDRVKHYDDEIREGAILIGVQARSDEDLRALAEHWKAIGAEHVHAPT